MLAGVLVVIMPAKPGEQREIGRAVQDYYGIVLHCMQGAVYDLLYFEIDRNSGCFLQQQLRC